MKTVVIAVLIIVMSLAALAVFYRPEFVRETPVCRANLLAIDSAKELAAVVHRWPEGTDCDVSTNKSLVNQFIMDDTTPVCPDGGTYAYNRLGREPICSESSAGRPDTQDHRFPQQQ